MVLALVVGVLPVSFLSRHGFGIVRENTPAFGWIFDCNSGGISDFKGYGVGIFNGHFFAYSYRPVTNPKRPLTSPPFMTLDYDDTRWHGSVRHGIGVGTWVAGDLRSSWWTARSGVAFPFWPISLISCVMLVRLLGQMYRCRSPKDASFCPTCSYDLRACINPAANVRNAARHFH